MITVNVIGGASLQVMYVPGMNAQNAMEDAYNYGNPNPTLFSFAVQYYGYSHIAPYSYLGYLVIMINGQFDSTTSPYSYWEFFLNNQTSNTGIDSTLLNDGDAISFQLIQYNEESHSGTLLEHKHIAATKFNK